MRKAALGGALLLSASVLAACGDAPEDKKGDDKAGDQLPCMLSDEGGFDDKSFNQMSHEGLLEAVKELGSEHKAVESQSAVDYAPKLEGLVAEGCTTIIGVGFKLVTPVFDSAKANPDTHYMIIDSDGDTDFPADGKPDNPENVKPVAFDAAQGAFLAGYAAADYTKTGKVGTYGGIKMPSVNIFMDGFAQGVEYYNKEKGKDVKVVGWNRKTQDGEFTKAFAADQVATNKARQILETGVDVIFPVGGPVYQGAVTVISEGADAVIIGVDSDLAKTDANAAKYVLTSVLKDLGPVTKNVVLSSAKGEFDSTPYLGTLENNGVGLAPFYDYDSKVSSDLATEIETLKKAIISGDLKVESYLSK